ncbi:MULTISPECIES: LysR family transcriptional regulator [Rhodopseudomonas]|uniref:LysR family transcriptional regulator n=1 Tax=Rhodopseudomonas palustris TaxID=1076 RepID=A0A0D7EFG7_RHOPL|nr:MULTISPECIES: LysR family transcriptional regulator [Rhodopseudomonas]KIZ39391.1 LysR family transcriptional regulator [Rhodopseudomonas palustris]MDF3809580.1 LysR family transcriptional regulator [Rhodopseudomonas sp. BAL398]WOK17776.1 LysR family transcriptional regulator [Rhodopseudomonas sp. BAL398]
MTLEQLRIFVAVAAREHVTQGARDLNLTQSATSAAIAALEAQYATRLFDRIGRRIALTEAGRVFLVEARAVLARAAAAETVLTDLAGLKSGSLILAASQTVANYWLPPMIGRYQARHPGIAIKVMIGNTEAVAGLVQEGAADIGYIEGAIDDPTLSISPVADDDLVLVVHPAHPWATRAPLPRNFATARWILRERGSGTRSMFEAALPGLGVDPRQLNVALELPSNEAVRSAVEAGAGVTVVSRLVVAAAIKAGTLVAVDVAMPKRQFFTLRHKERYVTQAGQEFDRLVAEGVPPAQVSQATIALI